MMKERDQQWLQKEKLQLNVDQLLKKQLQREKPLQRERQLQREPQQKKQLQRERQQQKKEDKSSKKLTIVN
jgi:hypothetical protein